MRIILASKSRDRKKLFDNAGIEVEVLPSNFDERSIDLKNVENYQSGVQKIAVEKAKTVFLKIHNNPEYNNEKLVIIAADTMIVYKGEIIGKARDINHAFSILEKLQGETHTLMTAVSMVIYDPTSENISLDIDNIPHISFIEESKITFLDLEKEEIWHYLKSSEEYMGRAGAYSLAERASFFIDHIQGSPSNVIGLPMSKIYTHLKLYGIDLLTYKHKSFNFL